MKLNLRKALLTATILSTATISTANASILITNDWVEINTSVVSDEIGLIASDNYVGEANKSLDTSSSASRDQASGYASIYPNHSGYTHTYDETLFSARIGTEMGEGTLRESLRGYSELTTSWAFDVQDSNTTLYISALTTLTDEAIQIVIYDATTEKIALDTQTPQNFGSGHLHDELTLFKDHNYIINANMTRLGIGGMGESTSELDVYFDADIIFADNRTHKFIEVPEPASIALLALGIAGLRLRNCRTKVAPN